MYTKGEWLVNEYYRCVTTHDDDIPLFSICYFGNNKLECQNIANAHLIAASPKLLEACMAAYRWYYEGAEGDYRLIGIQLEQALAKAEGK